MQLQNGVQSNTALKNRRIVKNHFDIVPNEISKTHSQNIIKNLGAQFSHESDEL